MVALGIQRGHKWTSLEFPSLFGRLGDGRNSYLSRIQGPGDHFRSHPVGGSNQGLPFRDVFADLSTESKVGEFHLGWGEREKDV